jgi:hypothetical protein
MGLGSRGIMRAVSGAAACADSDIALDSAGATPLGGSAGGGTAFAAEAMGAGAGDPMAADGMTGRERCAAGPPTSIIRVTTTAGEATSGGRPTVAVDFVALGPTVGAGTGGARGAANGSATATGTATGGGTGTATAGDACGRPGAAPARVAGDAGLPELGSGRAGGGGLPSWPAAIERPSAEGAGARPSVGGRLIGGPSSATLDSVVVDTESVSVFVVGGKSLERMLIAEAAKIVDRRADRPSVGAPVRARRLQQGDAPRPSRAHGPEVNVDWTTIPGAFGP